jgi:type I restriction enzyme S subunit
MRRFDGGSSADVLTIRVFDKKYNPKFVYYNLFQDCFFDYAMQGAKGSKMPRGDKNQILNFEIPNYDLPTQTAIASVLSSFDDKIALNNKINAELEQTAKLIYDYWFVQKADKNWSKRAIGEMIKKYTDNSLHIESKNILHKGKYPIVTQEAGNIISGYTNENKPIIDLPIIFFGDHSCTLRYIGFLFFRGAGGTQLLYFDNDLTLYVYHFLISVISQIPNYGKYERHFKYLKDLVLPVPDNQTLQKFNLIVKAIFLEIQKNYQQSNELRALRDWLLPMLMTEQATVKDKGAS